MAITSTGYQAPATSRQGLKPSVYDKIILIGADVDPRLAGQGIFYALEKDIAAQAYTPEIYAARLKQRGFSDESAQAFTQAYIQKDINIAKDYANGKAAEVYENNVRTRVAAEIKAKNEIEGEGLTMRDGGEANLEVYEGNGVIDFSSKIDDDFLRANATELEPSSNLFNFLAKTKNNPSRDKILNHFADKAGERDSKALDHRMAYLNYIMPTIEEPLIKIFRSDGRISNIKPFVFTDVNSKTKNVNFLSIVTDKDGNIDFITAYALKDKSQLRSEIKKGIKVEVRRGLARTFDPHSRVQVPSATDEIISQKGNLVNEKEANGLRDSVSSIGDNAGRADRRQAGDEQILRQGRRDTTNASQTKRPAQSDEQMEQQWAAKADGQADAAAATKQVVEKQGSGASIGGGLTANSNAHLGSGLVAGTLNSIDEDGNFSPERFAAGFLAGLAGGKAVATGLRKMTPKLYNQILGVAEKMPQMANDNPKLLGKLYSNGKDVSLNSFAGEKAITANVGKLDQAKAMLEKGADEVEIWQKTGWFKDEIDDKWKFEINPRGGELKPNPPRNTVLYNVLNDEKLYEAYPELQLYKVEVAGEYNPAALKALGSADGGFIPSQKTFIINEKTTDFKSTLYHEIQHAIQEIEGFSPGASSKNGKYWLAGGEVEARNVQKRMNDVSYDGFKNSTSMEFFPYKEEAQLQRMTGDKEYMEYHELSKKFDDYLNDKGDELSAQEEARLGELYEKIKDRLGFTGDDYKKGYELYLKENAEYQKHPLHTLDAPRGERVNIGHGDLNLSRELERDFLSKDRINLNALSKEATPLPKAISKNEFKAQFRVNDKGISFIKTPISDKFGDVAVNVNSAWKHLKSGNTYFSDRGDISGAFLDTLADPLFVVKQKYRAEVSQNTTGQFSQTRQNAKRASGSDGKRKIVAQDSLIFYKPFEADDGMTHLASFAVDANGNLIHKTFYDLSDNLGKLKALIKSTDKNVVYYKNSVSNENISYSRKIEEIKREHPNVERELDESIAAMRKESFNDSNFKAGLISKFDTKEITTQELGKSVNLSDKQLAVLKNDIKNADFKVINESKIYFDKIGKDGDKKRFFVDIAEDGSLRVDGYSKKDIDSIPVKQSALEELAGVGDAARLKNMSFEVKAAYRNELDPIKKEAILKTAELNKLKKAAQSGDKAAAAKFEEFKAKNLDENGNIKDGLSLC
ncbi:LPD23 domain-containing protein [uncultured Campylobacter sp.]|uniref:LPD23 domain-containing protein n=1 Tax=uncultured Campylobacter sp. TaxID=218934 RepID=UPI00262DBB25|nr:LPD23 domain-containing protein [uncultured Campylobacter sp.]